MDMSWRGDILKVTRVANPKLRLTTAIVEITLISHNRNINSVRLSLLIKYTI